jgi:aconitase B
MRPSFAAMAATSADDKYTSASSPRRLGKHTETPGCSLCMGNQARVKDNATVVSTSTRNFPNHWSGKKGYLTDNEMFKYCQFYTGGFWKKSDL